MSIAVASSSQIAQWNKARHQYDRLSSRIALIRQRLNYARILADFAESQGTTIKQSDPLWWTDARNAVETLDSIRQKLIKVMDAAESGELAIRPNGNDLDVVAPEDLAWKWKSYRLNAGDIPTDSGFGVAPLIVLGIVVAVVVGGIITVTAISDLYSQKVDKELAVANRQAEIHFCADPASSTCKAWQKTAKTAPVRETKSAIDYLLGKGSGKKFAGGLALFAGAALVLWAMKS